MAINCNCSPAVLFKQPCSRQTIIALFLGQLLSLLITATGICSQLLARDNVQIPTTQSQLNYILLAAVFVPMFLCKRQPDQRWKLLGKWWVYPILALADVEANFFVVKAYQFTTISSIILLSSCLTTPFVMILSRIFLQIRYSFWHFIGVIVALGGIALLVFTEVFHDDDVGAANIAVGDALCAISAICYAISNVGQEKLVKQFDVAEFLGMMGLWGSLFNGIQVAILEREQIAAITWTYSVALLLVGFAVALFAIYVLVPQTIKRSSAAVYNMSLLTSNVWALAAAVILLGFMPSVLYLLAFVTVVVGIFIYTRAPTLVAAPANPLQGYQQQQDDDISISILSDTASVAVSETGDEPRASPSIMALSVQDVSDSEKRLESSRRAGSTASTPHSLSRQHVPTSPKS